MVLLALAPTGQAGQAPPGYRHLELAGKLVKWGAPELGEGATVTYAVVSEARRFPQARNCRGIGAIDGLLARNGIDRRVFDGELKAALAMWSGAADIVFRPGPAEDANILIGAETEPRGRAFTNVAYGAGAGDARPITRSLVCLNPERRWKVGFDGDLDIYDLRYTLLHEIGHAIGLDHPGAKGEVMDFRYREAFRTLQPGDVAGIAALYGAPRAVVAAPSAAGRPAGAASASADLAMGE